MNKTVKQLLILYLIIIILKIGLAYFIFAPSAFSDDYGYAKVARSIFYHGTFTVHEDISTRPPLYPLVLSLSYVFKNMRLVYFFMKVINALVSSLILIPAWLLSREFFNEKKAMLLTVMISVLPSHFGFTFFLMQENLFYPLFLFSIYFIYKSFTERSYKWDIFAGIFIGLSYLTKINALIFPVVVISIFLFKLFKKDYREIGKKIVMAVFFLITISPWIIRNGLIFSFNKNLILGGYTKTLEITTISLGWSFLLTFLTWFIMHIGYLMIATGFIFFIANFFTLKRYGGEKELIFSLLTFSSMILIICLASRTFKLGLIKYQTVFPWLTGRIVGRYVEVLLPLIFINGLLGFKYLKRFSKYHFVLLLTLLIFCSQLVFFQMFPINNMSLAWLGVLKFILDFLIYKNITFESVFSYWSSILFIVILLIISLLIIYLKSKLSIKTLLCAFIILFSLVSLLNFVIIYYNSYTYWYKGEQMQLGLWFNKYDTKTSWILFDERDGCKIFKTNQTCIYNSFEGGGSATLIGFWMNDEIRIGSVENLEDFDYVVSKHELELPLLKKTENGIFLYQVNKRLEYD